MYVGGITSLTDWLRIFLDVEKNKPILIDLQELRKSRCLIQANSGGGKSHIMRKGIEEAHGKIQQIVIDPEGEFHTLREKYPFLLVGKGPQADIQIDTKHAALLARKLMETGADVIIDLYELTPVDRIRFVKLFYDAIINLPKHLNHPCLFWLDEIHVFAPESKTGRSESLAAVSALASRGRKRGYALIGATQRISKLSKDVAAELNTKLIGRCSLDIDRKRAGEELGIKDTIFLRKLKHEFMAFGPAISDDNVLVKAYETKTSSEEIGVVNDYKMAAGNQINKMLSNFQELPQEVELDLKTKQGLESKVQELQTKLRVAEKNQPIIKQDVGELNKAWKKGFDEAIAKTKPMLQELEKTITQLKIVLTRKDQVMNKIKVLSQSEFQLIDGPTEFSRTLTEKGFVETKKYLPESTVTAVTSAAPGQTVTVSLNDELKLTECPKRILIAIVQSGKPISRRKAATLAHYSIKKSTFRTGISVLNKLGYITKSGDDLEATQEGISALGDYETIPSDTESLLRFWVNEAGACPGAFLKELCSVYPNGLTREELSERTGYDIGVSTFRTGISKLNILGLIDTTGKTITASDEMFP